MMASLGTPVSQNPSLEVQCLRLTADQQSTSAHDMRIVFCHKLPADLYQSIGGSQSHKTPVPAVAQTW